MDNQKLVQDTTLDVNSAMKKRMAELDAKESENNLDDYKHGDYVQGKDD